MAKNTVPAPAASVLIACRDRRGLAQEEVARAAGLSVRELQELERGSRHRVFRKTVKKLAIALGVEICELMAPSPPGLTPAMAPIMAKPAASAAPDLQGSVQSSAWADTLEEVRCLLREHRSVNLVVIGEPPWREFIYRIPSPGGVQHLRVVDMQNPATFTRRGLVAEILKACDLAGGAPVPEEPEDLQHLSSLLSERPPTWLALTHFDSVRNRSYGTDFFDALRYLVSESKSLIVLIQSRSPMAALIPADHPLSSFLPTLVELRN